MRIIPEQYRIGNLEPLNCAQRLAIFDESVRKTFD